MCVVYLKLSPTNLLEVLCHVALSRVKLHTLISHSVKTTMILLDHFVKLHHTEKPTVRAQTRSFTTCLSTVADQVVSGFFFPLLTAAHHTSKIPLSCVCAAQCYPAVPRFQSDQAFVGFTRTSSIQRDPSPQQRKPEDLQCCSYSFITQLFAPN